VSDRASSETTASSLSSASRSASRTAVDARVIARPSRRLSRSARCASLLFSSARTWARSLRSSSVTAWNFVRVAGVTLPFRRAVWTSRTEFARTDMTSPPWSRPRLRSFGASRRALVWGLPRRAKNFPPSGYTAGRPWLPPPRTVLRSGDGRRRHPEGVRRVATRACRELLPRDRTVRTR
jgi:hypothetical protein